jgi:hypothetical protein
MARSTLSYQKSPLIVTVVGLGLSGWLGWATTGTYGGMLSFLFVGAILAANLVREEQLDQIFGFIRLPEQAVS